MLDAELPEDRSVLAMRSWLLEGLERLEKYPDLLARIVRNAIKEEYAAILDYDGRDQAAMPRRLQ